MEKDIEDGIKKAIQQIGNKYYEEATKTLYDMIKGDEITETVEKVPEEKVEERPKAKPVYTKTGLKALNKNEQVKILKELGATSIPRLEGNRIKKILELAFQE